MCSQVVLTWDLVGIIAVLVAIFFIAVDLLIRYLDSESRGLIPYRTILSPFLFLSDDTPTFLSVDKKYRP